jgi:hypothetical protein
MCAVCLKDAHGLFVEGEIVDNELRVTKRVCADCYRLETNAVVSGENGGRAAAPAYAHR